MYDIESKFPDAIDDLIFFSDISYSKKYIETNHRNLLRNGKYSEASEYLNNQEDITPYSADLLNCASNRIRATQDYLLNKDIVKSMHISDEEPDALPNTNWISYE